MQKKPDATTNHTELRSRPDGDLNEKIVTAGEVVKQLVNLVIASPADTCITLKATYWRDRNDGNRLKNFCQKKKQNHIRRHCDPALMRT